MVIFLIYLTLSQKFFVILDNQFISWSVGSDSSYFFKCMVINNCKVDTVKFVKIFYILDLEKVGVTAVSKEDLMRGLTDFSKLLLQISSI